MGEAVDRVSAIWDEVTQDFLAGKPTNTKPPLDKYCATYRRQEEIQLDGFCEPFLGRLDRQPKMAFLSLNPGEMLPAWQKLDWNDGRGGVFVNELREAGSYTKWAARWSYLQPHWQAFIKTRRGSNHHWDRFTFMREWYEDQSLSEEDRIDFELYPWHSHRFHKPSFRADLGLIRQFVLEPLLELEPAVTFAFGAWWWKNLDALEIEVVGRLGDGGDRPFEIGYKAGSRQGVTIGRLPHGGIIIAEKHGGPAPQPPTASKVPLFRRLILESLPANLRSVVES